MILPHNQLSVSDVERLAKAGVHVDFKDIAEQVTPDAMSMQPTPPEAAHWPTNLTDSFWQRWRRARPVSREHFGMEASFGVYASEYGDKVYVFVQPLACPPFIIEDTKGLYPSDALMAALMLHESIK